MTWSLVNLLFSSSLIDFISSITRDISLVLMNSGDLWIINVRTGEILEKRISAHSHSVIHILRYRRHIWTLDENGVLQLWMDSVAPGSTSPTTLSFRPPHIVSLDARPKTFRVGSKQLCAVVVGSFLWTGRDRSLEVLSPLDEASLYKKRIDIPGWWG